MTTATPDRFTDAQTHCVDAKSITQKLWDQYSAEPSRETREALILHYIDFAAAVSLKFGRRAPKYIDIDELTTAGMLGLIQAIDHFDMLNVSSFKSYASRIIKYRIKDYLRELGFWPRRKSPPKRSELCTWGLHCSKHENIALESMQIDDCLNLLKSVVSDREFSILVSFYFWELSVKEIAKRDGITVHNVHQTMHDARKKIRKNIPQMGREYNQDQQ